MSPDSLPFVTCFFPRDTGKMAIGSKSSESGHVPCVAWERHISPGLKCWDSEISVSLAFRFCLWSQSMYFLTHGGMVGLLLVNQCCWLRETDADNNFGINFRSRCRHSCSLQLRAASRADKNDGRHTLHFREDTGSVGAEKHYMYRKVCAELIFRNITYSFADLPLIRMNFRNV